MATLMLRDWSIDPGFLTANDDKSGEAYYQQVLEPAFLDSFSRNEVLSINLYGVRMLPFIFLNGSFLKLAHVFGPENVVAHLSVISRRSDWPRQIYAVIKGEYGSYKEPQNNPIMVAK